MVPKSLNFFCWCKLNLFSSPCRCSFGVVWVANSLVVNFAASSILCVDFVSLFVVASLWFRGVLCIVLCLFPACAISSVLSFFARKKKIL